MKTLPTSTAAGAAAETTVDRQPDPTAESVRTCMSAVANIVIGSQNWRQSLLKTLQ
jgi:hypothetical protein